MLDQLKKQAASSNEQDVKLRALEREAKSQRDLLESYLAKYREATARDNVGASSPEARIISRGIVSNTPSWPKKVPTVLIASLGMFTLVGRLHPDRPVDGRAAADAGIRDRYGGGRAYGRAGDTGTTGHAGCTAPAAPPVFAPPAPR